MSDTPLLDEYRVECGHTKNGAFCEESYDPPSCPGTTLDEAALETELSHLRAIAEAARKAAPFAHTQLCKLIQGPEHDPICGNLHIALSILSRKENA